YLPGHVRGNNRLAVRAEGDGDHPRVYRERFSDGLACRRVPEPGRLVQAARHDRLAVGAEGRPPDLAAVPLEPEELLPAGRVPQPDLPQPLNPASARDDLAVRTPGHRADRTSLP